jgi:hypothetical protein
VGAGPSVPSRSTYVEGVYAAIRQTETALGPDTVIAVDTTVFDSSDPEDARGACVRYLCEQGVVRKIVYLHMDGPRAQLGLITRVMRRAAGVEDQNPAADETSESVQHLLNKNSRFDNLIVPKIREFLAFAAAKGVPVLERQAIPLPKDWKVREHDRSVFEPYKTILTDA